MSNITDPIFDKVLFIGPDMRAKGGIASVLQSYSNNFAPFHFLATNSQRGKVPGYLRTIATAVRMPFARLKGRKIAHFHYCSGKSWQRKTILMRWARILGYKVVTHCHSAEMREFSQRMGYDRIRRVLDKSAANIVLSQSWVDFFSENIRCGNLHVINNIVDRPAANTSAGSSRPVTFLFLGQIGQRKGIFDILHAMAHLKGCGLKFRFIVGGNGETERFKAEVSRLGLDDCVDFRGWINTEGKERAFADSDVLLLPSYNEGLPIAILEAMARGKAVISSPVGGIPEVITDGVNGWFVNPGNIDEIETALRRYIDNPQLAAKHGGASAEIIEWFYPEVVGVQLIDIYRDILD